MRDKPKPTEQGNVSRHRQAMNADEFRELQNELGNDFGFHGFGKHTPSEPIIAKPGNLRQLRRRQKR